MESRAATIGGRLDIAAAADGRGTAITLEVPITSEGAST
jgi:signal transduction histidine kinase